MSTFLKVLSFSKSKHKKLPEEWGEGIKQPVNDGMIFYVKYLGSTLVDKPSSETVTAEAIKSIIAMAKLSGKKLPRVSLTVKPSGLKTQDVSSGETLHDTSIYRISYCSADATFDRVVAFIATNKNETMECHAFLTSKKKMAQAAALTISQAFTIAFENWQKSKSSSPSATSTPIKGSTVTTGGTLNGDSHGGSGGALKEKNHNESHAVNKNQSLQLIDLSFDDALSSNGTPKDDKTKNTFNTSTYVSFDNGLDDSFSKLAESRSASNFISSTTPSNGVMFPNGTLLPSSGSLNGLSSSRSRSNNPFDCSVTSVLPTNISSLDILDDELNALFTTMGRKDAKEQAEKNFFAEKDDLFSL